MIPIRLRNDDEALALLIDVLDVLRIGIEAFDSGRESAWLIISARLHQLLSDRTGRGGPDLPLALRVLTTLELHPLKRQAVPDGRTNFSAPFPIQFGAGKMKVGELFDMSALKVPLAVWLEQVALISDSVGITLNDLVRWPRHRLGGVHFDRKVTIEEFRIENSLTVGPSGRPLFVYYLHRVGEYVLAQLNAQIIWALGNGHVQLGQYNKARDFFNEAIIQFHSLGDLQGLSQVYNSMGYLAFIAGRFETAREAYGHAQSLNQQLQWQEAIENVELNLALIDKEIRKGQ